MESSAQVAVITVPFPGQSHLNQLLHFSHLISSTGDVPVYYVGSDTLIRQAKARITGLTSQDLAKIHFQDFPIPAFASPPPDPNSTEKFPKHLVPAWYAATNLRGPVSSFLREMSEKFKRVVVVHDTMMAYVVQDVASIQNAESYSFNCISAFAMMSLSPEAKEMKADMNVPSFEGCVPDEVTYLGNLQHEPLSYRAGDIYNTCRLIEPHYMESLEKHNENRKSWAIGPLLPPNKNDQRSHKCLEWLDEQEPNSVIYVSFGTTTSLSDEQITELAFGLEQSGVKFLWVLRDADKGDVFDGEVRRAELPEGFEERVKEVGMVVRDWAPQAQILAHESTGGFMSHCGWNSCLESTTMGVPIAAWPMHSEQPTNTWFLTEVLKIGVVVREWGERMEVVKASRIESVVRRLMASEEVNEMRKRAEELGERVRGATQEGGESRVEFESFIAHIKRS